MKIVTITGYKGGVGKSTTAIHLAAFLSEYGKTILIDGDKNRTSLNWAKRGKGLSFEVIDERNALRAGGSGSEFAIIDTPARPDSGDLQELAKGCELLILPTQPDIVSLEPALLTARDLGESQYRTLITMVHAYPSNREAEILRKEMIEEEIPIFNGMIRRTLAFATAARDGKLIKDVKKEIAQAAWQDYVKIGREVLEILS
jgi:chromosome partitioning protein